jgi:cathepsin B
LDPEIVESINTNPEATWVASMQPRFQGMSIEEVKAMLMQNPQNSKSIIPVKTYASARSTPTSFDSRTQWPGCIHPIRNQGQCGSCWAFGASEVLSDRFCISSDSKTNVILSPQALVSCDSSNQGCQGGDLQLAWQFLQGSGIPTDACVPYQDMTGATVPCPTQCQGGGAFTVYKAASSYQLNSVANIMADIVKNGPVEVAFDVYQDFIHYTSGVYVHHNGSLLGGHAVKAIGWGVSDTKQDYWIVANSWGTTWGIDGFFWILKGVNECGIESNVFAGLAGSISTYNHHEPTLATNNH